MLSKPISSNPAISGQRICKISIEINDDRTILKGETIYVDAQGNDIVDAVRRPFEFNTDGNMVDGATGMPAVMIWVFHPKLDENGDPMFEERVVMDEHGVPVLDGEGNPTHTQIPL